MGNFSIVLQQIGMFIIYGILGVLAIKLQILNRNGLDMISKLIVKILMPLLIFTNTINGTEKGEFLQALPILAAAVVYYAILLSTGFALKKCFHMKGNRGRVYHACSAFSNVGFMGIPVVTALFPDKGMIYISVFTVVDQLILWTIGVNLTLPVEGGISYTKKEKIKKMCNPNTIAILLAVAFIFLGISLPDFMNTALTKTGAMTTPLALIYLGGVFCFVNMGSYLKKIEIYGVMLVKMILLPMLMFFVFLHFPGLTHEMAVTLSVLCAMPVMTSLSMMAQSQHSDGDYAAGVSFATTLVSIVTLPVMCLFIH